MRVCVIGAGGFIASWIVHGLLKTGHTVHATIRDPADEKKNGHLKHMEGAAERLKLFKADLLDYESIVTAIHGCQVVVQTACPISDDADRVMAAAIGGTQNVLKACSEEMIKRIVLTSSVAAMAFDPNRPDDKIVDETCWSDVNFCREFKQWYFLAKTESEKLAWKLAEEYKLELVTICPPFVFGPILQPTVNFSNQILTSLMDGSTNYSNSYIPVVDVRDVAKAHIMAVEKANAPGRYLCMETCVSIAEIIDILKTNFPQFPYPQECVPESSFWKISPNGSGGCPIPPDKVGKTKILELIGEFDVSLEQMICDTVTDLRDKHLLETRNTETLSFLW